MKRCGKCKEEKPFDAFARSKAEKDGYFGWCKPCHSAHRRQASKPLTDEERAARRAAGRAYAKANRDIIAAKKRRDREKNRERIARYQRVYGAKKRAKRIKAMPPWADEEHIGRFYSEAEIMTRLTGIPHEVDHIVPLNGVGVCGLHAPANLRVVTKEFNMKKGNKLTLV
jgi:hypothetical protein